ncbi:MAG: DnaJ domain-containing protein, partial [Lentisphaeria bacterium]|nr:DnaJ domain-containing protein [Lentisphaeria bacterium]
NCTEASTDAEIKHNYKKLVKEYHPDKLVSKGLPKELIAQATDRFRQVQDAYEQICKLRKM